MDSLPALAGVHQRDSEVLPQCISQQPATAAAGADYRVHAGVHKSKKQIVLARGRGEAKNGWGGASVVGQVRTRAQFRSGTVRGLSGRERCHKKDGSVEDQRGGMREAGHVIMRLEAASI